MREHELREKFSLQFVNSGQIEWHDPNRNERHADRSLTTFNLNKIYLFLQRRKISTSNKKKSVLSYLR